MAKSRLYGWNGELPEKPLSGQALIVFNGIKAAPDEMRTGHGWTESIGKELATRQDPYRVVLYYILILKARGVIKTSEYDINAITRNGDEKHAVTVKTAATVEEREVIADPAPVVEQPVVATVDEFPSQEDLEMLANELGDDIHDEQDAEAEEAEAE